MKAKLVAIRQKYFYPVANLPIFKIAFNEAIVDLRIC